MVGTRHEQKILNLIISLPKFDVSVFSLPLETMTPEAMEPMQYSRYSYAAAVMNKKVYVAGGTSDNNLNQCSVECYDPAVGKWTKIANMNHPRANFGLVAFNAMLYAMGDHKSIERYDPVRDVWTEVQSEFS